MVVVGHCDGQDKVPCGKTSFSLAAAEDEGTTMHGGGKQKRVRGPGQARGSSLGEMFA